MNEIWLEIIDTVAVMAFAWFKQSEWWAARSTRNRQVAIDLVAAAVANTYDEYVKGLKDDVKDGDVPAADVFPTLPRRRRSLTPDERTTARKMAINTAVRAGWSNKLDVKQIVGGDAALAGMVSLLVNKAKPGLRTNRG